MRHSRFYWLQVNAEQAKAGDGVTAELADGALRILSSTPDELTLLLSDALLPLDKPVVVIHPSGARTEHKIERTAGVLATALQDRGDVAGLYSAVLKVQFQR